MGRTLFLNFIFNKYVQLLFLSVDIIVSGYGTAAADRFLSQKTYRSSILDSYCFKKSSEIRGLALKFPQPYSPNFNAALWLGF